MLCTAMANEILFDNSALSRLVEETDSDRTALVAGLRILGTLRVTALNVLESAKTPDPELRTRKLRFYKEITGTVAPMNRPVELLAMLARSYHTKSGSIDVGDDFAYTLLETPDYASDELKNELAASAKDEEHGFASIHREMRPRFGSTFAASPTDRFATEPEFLRFAFDNAEDTLHQMVDGFFSDATGAHLSPAEVREFLDAVPAWRTFIAAHLHALWLRAVRDVGPGKKKAGVVDTDSAAYLNFCGRFITNDKPQLQTLQTANEFNPRETVVELYSDIRSRLLL